MSGDLRDGQRKNLKAAYWSIGGLTATAGGVTIPVGLKVMGALALASPIVAGVAIVTAFGTMVGYRAAFRRALRKAREEMDKMLLALQQHLDTQALFGDMPPPTPTTRPRNSGDDVALITMIG